MNWLDSDVARIVSALSSRFNFFHYRSETHPLWSILVTTPFNVLAKVASLRDVTTAYVAAQAAALGFAFYIALRVFRIGRLDAFIVGALFLSTSTAWFWIGIPETFVWGGVSLLIAVIWTAAPRGAHDVWTGPAQSVLTLAMTVTNWVAGLAAALIALGWKRAFTVTAMGFAFASGLSVLQNFLFPFSSKFLWIWGEDDGIVREPSLHYLQVYFLHPLSMPFQQLGQLGDPPNTLVRSSNIESLSTSASIESILYLALWGALVAGGVWTVVKRKASFKPALLVGVIIASNLALHAFYGDETFLYAMHFAPFFTIVAAWSLLSGGRMFVRAAIIGAAVLGFWHNGQQFERMVDWYNTLPTEYLTFQPGMPC